MMPRGRGKEGGLQLLMNSESLRGTKRGKVFEECDVSVGIYVEAFRVLGGSFPLFSKVFYNHINMSHLNDVQSNCG